MPVPNIFANQSGSVPASELDENFQYVLDNSVQVSNPNVFTALQRMSGHCFDFAKSADIASAAALNLNDPQASSNPGTATGNFITVSGTNTITSVLLSSGALRIVRASGAFTWTNNAAISVMGGANWVATAGDLFIVQGDASGIVRVAVFPSTAAGQRTLGALGTMATQNASAVAITGGTIEATALGAITPAAGGFTSISATLGVTARSATATPAAAAAVAALSFGSAGLGVYWGSGDPNAALTGAKGSLYIRTDGSSSSTRIYVSDGGTTWISVTTAS